MENVLVRPSPGDNTPFATLQYGECAQAVLSRLPENFAQAIITELPAPGLGDYPETDWPAVSYCPHPLLAGKPRTNLRAKKQRCAYGSESSVEDYIAHTVHMFRLMKPVLRGDGTLWFHARDRYLEKKQLGMIPQQIALALQADGWVLRNEIIWQRDNTSPESALDRLTRTHGTLFMFAHPESSKKDATYYYDADSIREPHQSQDDKHIKSYNKNTNMADGYSRRPKLGKAWHPKGRNRRTVWNVNLGAYLGKALSPWPLDLVEPMVKAAVPGRDRDPGTPRAVVLDPFSGTATTGKAAMDWGADFFGIDIDREVLSEARARLEGLTHSRRALQQKESPILEMFS